MEKAGNGSDRGNPGIAVEGPDRGWAVEPQNKWKSSTGNLHLAQRRVQGFLRQLDCHLLI